MNYRQYRYLMAEAHAVRSMLDRMPADAVIDRASTQARLKKIEAELQVVLQQMPNRTAAT